MAQCFRSHIIDWGGMEGIGASMLQKSYYRLWWHGGYRWVNASEVILYTGVAWRV